MPIKLDKTTSPSLTALTLITVMEMNMVDHNIPKASSMDSLTSLRNTEVELTEKVIPIPDIAETTTLPYITTTGEEYISLSDTDNIYSIPKMK